MKCLLLPLLFFTLLTTALSIAAEPTLDVSIAVPKQFAGRIISGQHFHVVVTNTSDKPQNLWREWCSWGYYALRFEITENGKTQTVKKNGQAWTRNFPDACTLAPHEHLVLEVEFANSEVWENFPKPTGISPVTVTMKAIFEIKPDDETKKFEVWTGRIESKANEYVFYK